jgi:hypothetical protein
MYKRLFSCIKSLTFPNSRNFIITLRQEKYQQLGLFERRQNLLTKQQKVLTQEQEQGMKSEKIRSELQKHTDLESFLSRKDLNSDTNVHKGTLYEYETILCLQKSFGIISKRVGGGNDFGIDFRAKWKLPNDKKLNLVGQCKNISKKCSPNSIRELEGVLGMEAEDTLGILSSKSGFSKQSIRRFIASPCPLILVCVVHNGKRCKSFIWNDACKSILTDLEITLRFTNANDEFDDVSDDDMIDLKPILLFRGEPFIPNYDEQYW